MGTQLRVEAKAVTRASRELVWSMVSDASAYARWGPWDASGDGSGLCGRAAVRIFFVLPPDGHGAIPSKP